MDALQYCIYRVLSVNKHYIYLMFFLFIFPVVHFSQEPFLLFGQLPVVVYMSMNDSPSYFRNNFSDPVFVVLFINDVIGLGRSASAHEKHRCKKARN